MEEAFSQIEGAAVHSLANVSVGITSGGSIVGQGVTASGGAIRVCGGNLDKILESFGGADGADGGNIEGGNNTIGGKSARVVKKSSALGSKLHNHLEKELTTVHEEASDLEQLASMAKSALKHVHDSEEAKSVLEKIIAHVDEGARAIRGTVNKEVKVPKQKVSDFIERNGQFVRAIKSLGAHMNESSAAGMLSLSFTSVNELKKLAKEVSSAIKTVGITKGKYFGSSLSQLDRELTNKLAGESKKMKTADMKEFLNAWSTLMQAHGLQSELKSFVGGMEGGEVDGGEIDGGVVGKTDTLVDRLTKTRTELKNMINKFINAFGHGINGMVAATNDMTADFGKRVDYDEHTIQFLESYKSLNEYLDDRRRSKLYQYLLELNQDTEVDSKEVKERFLSTMRYLAERADAMDKVAATKSFATACREVIESVNKFNDMIKTHRDEMKKQGGTTESMNELFSVDAAKIDIVGLLTPLDGLKTAIAKLDFFRNIAIFRSNLNQTSKELATYSKDYTQSVGKAIGDAITKIKNEYTDIINQVSDNKAGMGLEIDMYNESAPKDKKISKEKLKLMYKWQCEARMGLYKTIEAIDMYLLHFTETVSKNPDAVADLHKMLTATKIIAKWYDVKAGENLIRMFESFRNPDDPRDDVDLDAANFIPNYLAGTLQTKRPAATAPVDLTLAKILGPKANQIYERCRRAVEGVVVLKNIISYFITISEKYGDFKNEKNIYMAPSNIYKNLVNYIWVSAIDVTTTGSEILNDNNEPKRILSYRDTGATLAMVTDIDPTTMGINFNKHSIDKLRILKCHNDLMRLRDFTASMNATDMQRVKQFVTGVFARLGKTKYIYPMILFGVYDFSVLSRDMIEGLLEYLRQKLPNRNVTIAVSTDSGANFTQLTAANQNNIVNAIFAIEPRLRNSNQVVIRLRTRMNGVARNAQDQAFVSLSAFQALDNDLAASLYKNLMGMDGLATLPAQNAGDLPAGPIQLRSAGPLIEFLEGLVGSENAVTSAAYGKRTIGALHYCVMEMLDLYKAEQSNSLFAIDDTYFILTIKAIAGKIMAVTGINGIFKKTNAMRNALVNNPTRLIMGGANGDNMIIDSAVELYVRLPLLVEFYRNIFENANHDYKNDTVVDALDEERVAFVPEIGNVWSGLLLNIFDKSKHIASGLYTQDNMARIVQEINAIYKHYSGSVPADQLVRHIMMQLVAEINRRYGIIKRQDLQEYYRVTRAAKSTELQVGELNYTNNDLDILDESMEFEEKAPSDEFIKFKATLADPATPIEQKINKLTDYRILRDFRGRIQAEMAAGAAAIAGAPGAGGAVLSLVDRIRALKKAISLKQSKDEKYDMIIKAIEESNAMNQSSNDIFMCFHEFVLVPLRTAFKMHRALELFMLNMYMITTAAGHAAGLTDIRDHPILQTQIKQNNGLVTLMDAMRTLVDNRYTELVKPDRTTIILGGNIANNMQFNRNAGNPARSTIDGGDGAAGTTGAVQILAMNALLQFATNSGDLVKLDISSTKRITIDLSEYQKVCEHLVSNCKYMIDKFTGLVPNTLIQQAASVASDGIFSIEDALLRKMFNKANKGEQERDLLCLDNLYKIMPVVSNLIFNQGVQANQLFKKLILHNPVGTNFFAVSAAREAKPIIRDAFALYSSTSKMFVQDPDATVSLAPFLYDPFANVHIDSILPTTSPDGTPLPPGGYGMRYGIVQEFNTLIANYMNDLYDAQSHKIYTKTFASFAGSALVDALNKQSFPDFHWQFNAPGAGLPNVYAMGTEYVIPNTQVVFSSALAYVMKIMSNRVNPVTGMKIHEVTSLQEVAPHVMEKYRALIPMYLRIFKAFQKRCKLYRKIIGNANIADGTIAMNWVGANIPNTNVRDTRSDTDMEFANPITPFGVLNGGAYDLDGPMSKDLACLYIDEVVNGMAALIQDASAVQKELLETDATLSLYFDIKRDFTKNYFMENNEYPFAPLSIMTMGIRPETVLPLYGKNIINNKFTYGLRSMLNDDFKLTANKVPYLKKIISEFNGYTTTTNNISEAKFNDSLQYVSRAMSFIYDLRFFNGIAVSRCDMLNEDSRASVVARAAAAPATPRSSPRLANGVAASPPILTFQETMTPGQAMTIIESVNSIDSRNKIADYVKQLAGAMLAALPGAAAGVNPRSLVMMVNLHDLNIIPINVHSLMREIPLANLYNYAMTFDEIVSTLDLGNNTAIWQELLVRPYTRLVKTAANQLQVGALAPVAFANIIPPNNMRFVKDVLFSKLLREPGAAVAGTVALAANRFNERANSKIFHNLLFLSLVQYAIKIKVKSELEFINTKVVSNTNAVNNIITNATDTSLVDAANPNGEVRDDLFEF